MEAIEIIVQKDMDGYSFSILPHVRTRIRTLFPHAHPANGIYIGYDVKSGFESQVTKLEKQIYPALLGLENNGEIGKKVDEIRFVDLQTGGVLAKLTP